MFYLTFRELALPSGELSNASSAAPARHRAASWLSMGSTILNVVPWPTTEFTSIVPPWRSTMLSLMASPSPEPPDFLRRVEWFEDVRQMLGGNAPPVVTDHQFHRSSEVTRC